MTISDTLKGEAWSDASDLPLVLVEIDHADFASPIRVVNNTEDVSHGGNTYTAFPFEITLPSAEEDAPPRARFRIDNVSREIGQNVRLIASPPDVTITVIRQDDPATVEAQYVGLKWRNVRLDALSVEGDLVLESLAEEPYPALTYSPAEFPGLVQ